MSPRILIVDDEEHIRRVMRLTLEAAGYQVGEAGSGEDALDRFSQDTRWDVIVLDERMPGIDGLETLRRLQAMEAGAAVIMATAFASVELAVEAMKLGATDFLRKPMTPEMLRAAVAAAHVKRQGGSSDGVRQVEPPADRVPHYEAWTMNGFQIRHVRASSDAREHRFEVRRQRSDPPEGALVRVEPGVVAAAERVSGEPLGGGLLAAGNLSRARPLSVERVRAPAGRAAHN